MLYQGQRFQKGVLARSVTVPASVEPIESKHFDPCRRLVLRGDGWLPSRRTPENEEVKAQPFLLSAEALGVEVKEGVPDNITTI